MRWSDSPKLSRPCSRFWELWTELAPRRRISRMLPGALALRQHISTETTKAPLAHLDIPLLGGVLVLSSISVRSLSLDRARLPLPLVARTPPRAEASPSSPRVRKINMFKSSVEVLPATTISRRIEANHESEPDEKEQMHIIRGVRLRKEKTY